MSYTWLALIGVGFAAALDLLVLGTRVLATRTFWVAYAIIVTFQLSTNGILTGTEIVRYAGDEILGADQPQFVGNGRLVYAPVEDLLFGFSLILQTLSWWVFWGRRGVQRQPASGPPRWRR